MKITRFSDDPNALLFGMIDQPFPLTSLYHENSKLTEENAKQLGQDIAEISGDPVALERRSLAFKAYPTAPRVPLPSRLRLDRRSVEATIEKRRTRRRFSGRSIHAKSLGRLLRFGCGRNAEVPIEDGRGTVQILRTYPSGGALYPLEVYPVVLIGDGVQSGIYHYNVYEHSLESLRDGEFSSDLERLVLTEGYLKGAALILVITAVFERTLSKYGERGYRFVLIEVGHMAQNLLLVAESLGLGAVPFGGFLDDQLADFLQIDARTEPPLYVIGFGHPQDFKAGENTSGKGNTG